MDSGLILAGAAQTQRLNQPPVLSASNIADVLWAIDDSGLPDDAAGALVTPRQLRRRNKGGGFEESTGAEKMRPVFPLSTPALPGR